MEELYGFKIAFILYIHLLYIKSPTGKRRISQNAFHWKHKLLSLHDHTLLLQDGEVFRSDANRHEIGQAVSRLAGQDTLLGI